MDTLPQGGSDPQGLTPKLFQAFEEDPPIRVSDEDLRPTGAAVHNVLPCAFVVFASRTRHGCHPPSRGGGPRGGAARTPPAQKSGVAAGGGRQRALGKELAPAARVRRPAGLEDGAALGEIRVVD